MAKNKAINVKSFKYTSGSFVPDKEAYSLEANEKKIIESRLMPSIYVIEKIRNSISSQNDIELLLSILASINGKQWSEIHPEHLRLILLGLKSYNNNLVLDKVLLEILEQCNII